MTHKPQVDPSLIKKIEDFNETILPASEKVILLLVLSGEKPAGYLLPEAIKKKSNYNLLQTLFSESHLAVLNTGDLFYISKDPRIIYKLQKFFGNKNLSEKERSRKLGLLMGFPKTAVEFYVKHINNPDRPEPILPEEIKSSEYMDFHNFIFSKEHWSEEIKIVKRWTKTIKKISPDLYKKFTSVRQRFERLKKKNQKIFKELIENEKTLKFIKFRDPEFYAELTRKK